MHFLGAKHAKNSFVAGALPQTPLGELSALPNPLARFNRPTSKGRGGEGKGIRKERGGRRKMDGRGIPVLLFPHFEPWTRCSCLIRILLCNNSNKARWIKHL